MFFNTFIVKLVKITINKFNLEKLRGISTMKKIDKNKIVKKLKLIIVILIIILIAFSQVFDTRNTSNKFSPKDVWLLIIYTFGIIFIPLIVCCIVKFKEIFSVDNTEDIRKNVLQNTPTNLKK